MKSPHGSGEGASEKSKKVAKSILADQRCPNMPLCQRWSATDGGTYCRLCWRDFTHPKPIQVTERRA